MKESTKNVINLIILHLVSIFTFLLLAVAVIFLYPMGYFDHALSYLWMLSGVGILFIYKRPDITKKIFTTTVIGSILTVLLYILTTPNDWTVLIIAFVYLAIPCILLLCLVICFLK